MASRLNGKTPSAAGEQLTLYLQQPGKQPSVLASTRTASDGSFSFELEAEALARALALTQAANLGATLTLESAGAPEIKRATLGVDALSRATATGADHIDLGQVDLSTVTARTSATLVSGPSVVLPATDTGVKVSITPGDLNPTGASSIDDLQAGIRLRDSAIETYKSQLSSLTLERDQAAADRDRTLAMLKAATDTADQLRARSVSDSTELARLTALSADKEAAVKRLEAQQQALTEQLTSRDRQIADALSDLQQKSLDLTNTEAARKLAETKITTLSTQLASRDARISELEKALSSPIAPAQPVALASVFDGIRSQVAAVDDNTDKLGTPWKLSDLRFSLKVLVAEDGTKVRFPKPGETTSAGTEISAVDFGLRPTVKGGEAASPSIVPDLVGYTTLVAERKLRDVRLAVATSFQTVQDEPNEPKRAGRVIRQRPAAGSSVAPGTTVELWVGKA